VLLSPYIVTCRYVMSVLISMVGGLV